MLATGLHISNSKLARDKTTLNSNLESVKLRQTQNALATQLETKNLELKKVVLMRFCFVNGKTTNANKAYFKIFTR